MKRELSVLIIEDHQLNIEVYRRALEVVKNEIRRIELSILEAADCQQALEQVQYCVTQKQTLDIVFLDISLPPSLKHNILNGESLGRHIKTVFPQCKLLVCTTYTDVHRLNNIIQTLNPESFLVKADIGFSDFVMAITKIANGDVYYSKTVINLMRKRFNTLVVLDDLDIKILYEISNGARMKELRDLVPLSKTGIERRKKLLKFALNVKEDSDRALVLKAKEKGFI